MGGFVIVCHTQIKDAQSFKIGSIPGGFGRGSARFQFQKLLRRHILLVLLFVIEKSAQNGRKGGGVGCGLTPRLGQEGAQLMCLRKEREIAVTQIRRPEG